MNADGPGGYQRRRRGRGAGPGGPGQRDAGADTSALAGAGIGEQKRSLIETALLISLIEESGHGYALTERVQQLVGDQLYVDPASVYRILRLLEEAGMVSSSWEAGTAGPQRRTYTVEPSGRELLSSWAEVLAERGNALLELSRLARERVASR
ncbi:MAG: helix-turn-helix transcriptional regulator [Thermoleophilia bacterium]|nr:helix-turn-helix transcriptional regulator [Thermoleophilia bacterium]